MADVLLVTDRGEDLLPLVSALESGGHRIVVVTTDEAIRAESAPQIIFVDAVKDLARGRDACRTLRQKGGKAALLALVGVESLDAIGPDWEIDSFFSEAAPPSEALARIRLVLGPQISASEETVRVGDLSIDPETYQVRLKGRPLDLTYKEFQLLFYLAQRPGRVYSRQQLLQEVWGYDFFGGTRTVDVHVRRLRAKLGAEHENMIATIRNVGYKMDSHRTRS